MILAWFFMLVELAVELVSPFFMAKIIDEGIMASDFHALRYWGIWLAVISILAFAAGILNSFFASHASQSFAYDIREALFTKIQSLPYSQVSRLPAPSLITRMTNDVTQVQNTLFVSLRIAFRAPLLIIFGALSALVINWKLAGPILVSIPLLVLFLIRAMQKSAILFRTVQRKLDQVNGTIREYLAGIRLVKAFYQRKHGNRLFDRVNRELRDSTMVALRFVELTAPVLLFIMNTAIVLMIDIGKRQLAAGVTEPGEIVAIINYGTRITHALSQLSWILMAFSRAKASSDRLKEVLEMKGSETGGFVRSIERGAVSFEHVTFSYPDQDRPVLSDISFSLEPGQRLAIMGATGSGKSTLLQLILKLYEPVSGAIKIDGINIRLLDSSELRNAIGYVPQEPHLFTGTICENIAWGKKDATDDEIHLAASMAQIHDSILTFSRGYQTPVGQRGANLSGGQKQRLSIARALVRRPKILLLDDCTSALDPGTESRLFAALEPLQSTMLIVTNKVLTAQKADFILLLEEGRTIGLGTHEQLLEKSPVYREIVRSQAERGVLIHARPEK